MVRAAIYCRVSTKEQDTARQERDLREFASRMGYDVKLCLHEKASGMKDDRSVRAILMGATQARRVDVVLVTELSRWGRSTADLLATVSTLAAQGVSLITMRGLSLDWSTPQGKLMATLLAGVAEFERDLIAERVKSGVRAARARGVRFGRKQGDKLVQRKHGKEVLALRAAGHTQREIARRVRISRTTVQAILATTATDKPPRLSASTPSAEAN